jgi:pimeloyl-ACP methyl ester carboxylesterase/DNA-binding CsgD family transcriptional regulator
MGEMLNDKDLEAVFAVIPEMEARQARRELSDKLSRQKRPLDGEIAWVDFNDRFDVLRAGVTDMGGLSSRLIFRTSETPDLNELIMAVAAHPIKAGSILLSKSSDRIMWFVPATHATGTAPARVITKGLSIGAAVFQRLVDGFNPSAHLTDAEHRVVYLLTAGLSLQESADYDGLKFETRRGQLKRACAKLDVSGQNALIRLILSQAIHLLFLVDDETKHAHAAETFLAQHLPNTVRLEMRRLPNGRLLRLYEAGPADGTPVVVFHGLFFASLMQGLAPVLDTHNIRLILPLRVGYLVGDTGAFGVSEHDTARQNIADFQSYIETVFGRSVIVMGHSMGCIAALKFAHAHPDWTRHLVLVSAFLGRDNERGYLGRILKILARRPHNSMVFRLVAQQFSRSYARRTNARAALRKIFGHSAADMAVIEGRGTTEPADSWFGEAFGASTSGIAEDFRALTRMERDALAPVTAPITA